MKPEKLIHENDDELIFENLSNPRVVSELIDILNNNLQSFNKNLILNFKNVQRAFPNACVPIAGILENLSAKGVDFEFYYLNDYLKALSIKQPLIVQKNK